MTDNNDSLLDYRPQAYGDDPTQTRDTNNYTTEYVRRLVEKRDEIIEWD